MSMLDEIAELAINLLALVPPAGYPPIRTVYQTPPTSPPTTEDLPAFIIFVRNPKTDIQIGAQTFGDDTRQTRYTLQFLYTPVGQGTLEASYKACLAYLDPILDVLWLHGALGGIVNWARPTVASMPYTLPEHWGGQEYFGLDVTLEVLSSRSTILGV